METSHGVKNWLCCLEISSRRSIFFCCRTFLLLFWGRRAIVLLQIGSWLGFWRFLWLQQWLGISIKRKSWSPKSNFYSRPEQKSLEILIYSFNCYASCCSFMCEENEAVSCHCAFNLFLDKFYDSFFREKEAERAADVMENVMGKSDTRLVTVVRIDGEGWKIGELLGP